MICCFTGPRAFPWKEESSQHRDVLRQLDAAILQAIELGATHFLCGNAIGVDTWAAELLIRQKKQHPVNIPPQTGQQNGGNRSRVTVEMSPGVRL